MISPLFKIKEFLSAIVDMNYDEIIKAAERECRAADRISYGVKGAVNAREMGSTESVLELKSFLHFMRYRGHSGTPLREPECTLYRPVSDALVEKGEFDPSILALFK
jgi:hypothetical protein